MRKLVLKLSEIDKGNVSLVRELSCLKVYLRDPHSRLVPRNRLQLYKSLRLDSRIWRDLFVFFGSGTQFFLPFYCKPIGLIDYSLNSIDIDYGVFVRQSFLNRVLEKIDMGKYKSKKIIIKDFYEISENRKVAPNFSPLFVETTKGRREVKKLFLNIFRKALIRLEKYQ